MSGEPQRTRFSWRRFVRFSLRALSVLVLCISCWARISGSTRPESPCHAKPWPRSGAPAVPCTITGRGITIASCRRANPGHRGRLIDFVGIDYFGHVTAVRLGKPDDATLAHVGRLARLQQFSFGRWPVNTAALEQLKGLSELTGLYCGSGTITDDDMAILKDMTRLTRLTIDPAGGVTDAGLAHLKRMVSLTELRLPRTQVTDAGLAHLKGLAKLSILEIDGTRVTDAGLENLKGLTKLKMLFLGHTRGTQAGLDKLKRLLPSVEVLH